MSNLKKNTIKNALVNVSVSVLMSLKKKNALYARSPEYFKAMKKKLVAPYKGSNRGYLKIELLKKNISKRERESVIAKSKVQELEPLVELANSGKAFLQKKLLDLYYRKRARLVKIAVLNEKDSEHISKILNKRLPRFEERIVLNHQHVLNQSYKFKDRGDTKSQQGGRAARINNFFIKEKDHSHFNNDHLNTTKKKEKHKMLSLTQLQPEVRIPDLIPK